jgi:hypothetical protein
MANEIVSSCMLRVANGSLKSTLSPGQVSIDQTAIGGPSPGMVVIGTSVEEIDFSELTALGVIQVTNLDATNYVDFGPDDSGGYYSGFLPCVRIEPGEVWQFRLVPGVTYCAKANSAACKVLFMGFNN